MKKYLPAVLAALLIGGVTLAQQEVMLMGQDSSGNARLVLVDSNGRIVTSTSTSAGTSGATHGACRQTAIVVGTSDTKCPPTPLANRSTVTIQLTTSSQSLGVGLNGTGTTGGLIVTSGDLFSDNLAGTVDAYCVCTAAGCNVNVVECP